MRYGYERHVALEAVLKACRITETIRRSDSAGSMIEKADQSPVTVADFCAQASISLELLKAFPGDPMVAEENLSTMRPDLTEKVLYYLKSGVSGLMSEEIFAAIARCSHGGGDSCRFWVLDPVDGTKGFLRGEQYAIALALVENGKVVLGVLGCPNLPLDLLRPEGQRGCIFIATMGQGSAMRQTDVPLEHSVTVATANDPGMAVFCESVESAHSSHHDAAQVAREMGIKKTPVRIDSQCKYGIVARGDASVYLRLPAKPGYQEKIWDHAAGWLIVEEAGGEVTDINGDPIDFSAGRTLSRNRGIVATNGSLHHQVLSAIRLVAGAFRATVSG